MPLVCFLEAGGLSPYRMTGLTHLLRRGVGVEGHQHCQPRRALFTGRPPQDRKDIMRRRYTVQEGDTASGIAARNGMNLVELLGLNPKVGMRQDYVVCLGEELTLHERRKMPRGLEVFRTRTVAEAVGELQNVYKYPSPDEPCFIIRGRDPLAMDTILAWVHAATKNGVNPSKIAGAITTARACAAWPSKRLPE